MKILAISQIVKYVTIAIIAIIATSSFFKYCNKPNNEIVTNSSLTTPFKSEVKYLKDSTHYLEVEAKVAESKATIQKLQDSLQKVMTINSKLKATGLISYTSSADFTNLSGDFKDKVDTKLGQIIDQQKQIDSNANKIDYSNLISVPQEFEFAKDKWVRGVGTVKKKGVSIDSLHFESEPTIAFGTTQKKFLGIPISRPTIKAVIGDNNPFMQQSNPKVYLYQPKQSKIGLVIGTGASFDGKTIQYTPVQLTLGYKIF